MRVSVLNGVNLDMVGRRDPEVYGGLNIRELETRIFEWAMELELNVTCRQTNSEGEYVNWCHEALDWADGVVVNPGAWTHYSYAIRDALEREEWRRNSVISDLAAKRVIGNGPRGYREALAYLAGNE